MLLAVNLQKFEVVKDYTQDKQGMIGAGSSFLAYPWQAQQFQWRGVRYGLAFVTLQASGRGGDGTLRIDIRTDFGSGAGFRH